MRIPSTTTHQKVKALLNLPSEARADEVFECVMGCLTDALNCELIAPARLPGKRARYQAAWLARDGTRYEAEGRSDREAALAAAVRFISEAEEGEILRAYAEPELKRFEPPVQRRRASADRRPKGAPGLRTVRRAGGPE